MRLTKLRSIALSIAFLSIILFSCKKDEVSTRVDTKDNSNSTASIKTNLVAWYKFTNGNTADFSGRNNHLTAYNVTKTTDYMGRPNNAYYFDGFSGYMIANDSPSLSPSRITIAVLIKPMGYYNGSIPTSRILMKGTDDQSNGDYFLGLNNTGSVYGVYGDNQYQSNEVTSKNNLIQLNNWYKIVYTYDGNVGKLYLNDSLVKKVTSIATFNPNSSPLRIGVTGRYDYPFWYNGVIDEIRIYNTALSRKQVSNVDSTLGLH